jgi:hypothetical protein
MKIQLLILLPLTVVALNSFASGEPENKCLPEEKAFRISESVGRDGKVIPAHYKCIRFSVDALNRKFSSNVEALRAKINEEQFKFNAQ